MGRDDLKPASDVAGDTGPRGRDQLQDEVAGDIASTDHSHAHLSDDRLVPTVLDEEQGLDDIERGERADTASGPA
jgi:hypothetical protein